MRILDNFKLKNEKEDFKTVFDNIDKGVVFKGTNLWVLVIAIFMASLGLNVNSTAVIIGAMLISPLMGPIMGLGLGMGISDLPLLKKALYNYLFAAGVSLTTSTIYFLLTPITGADSEMLSRTSPTIYDVLIALFGGLAGMMATSSKQKGNVIPGVAIATALMPPLCTAGYGLANLKFDFFFGAFYLFFINTVFIAFATFITARILKFPLKPLTEKKEDIIAKRFFFVVVLITLLPSIYFGYDLVNRNKFFNNANNFITSEAIFPNNYLLKKNIDTKNKTITLTYGGQFIKETEIQILKKHLPKYQLDTNALDIRQGFSYLNMSKEDEKTNLLQIALDEKERQIQLFKNQSDSLKAEKVFSNQIYNELKAQYPSIQSCILQKAIYNTNMAQSAIWILIVNSKEKIDIREKKKIEEWLKVRINSTYLKIYYEE